MVVRVCLCAFTMRCATTGIDKTCFSPAAVRLWLVNHPGVSTSRRTLRLTHSGVCTGGVGVLYSLVGGNVSGPRPARILAIARATHRHAHASIRVRTVTETRRPLGVRA